MDFAADYIATKIKCLKSALCRLIDRDKIAFFFFLVKHLLATIDLVA